jgi:hypothetical protein
LKGDAQAVRKHPNAQNHKSRSCLTTLARRRRSSTRVLVHEESRSFLKKENQKIFALAAHWNTVIASPCEATQESHARRFPCNPGLLRKSSQ